MCPWEHNLGDRVPAGEVRVSLQRLCQQHFSGHDSFSTTVEYIVWSQVKRQRFNSQTVNHVSN